MSLQTGHELVQALKRGRQILADGAVGTELLKSGVAPDRIVEANLSDPERVRNLHRRAIAAGAEIITANTFGMPTGDDWGAAMQAGVDLAEAAATELDGTTAVLIAVYPRELLRCPDVVLSPFRRPGPRGSLLLIETAVDIREASEAVALAGRSGPLTIAATCHFQADGLMQDGTTPEAAALALQAAGALIVGANCGEVPEDLVTVAQRMRVVTDLPLLFQPGAGLPKLVDGCWTYPVDPIRFAQNAIRLFQLGASIVGGCCGTTPAHIAAVHSLLFHPQRRE
jgi:5-methyltetrahydrofolate--homocysteine methyltransferase